MAHRIVLALTVALGFTEANAAGPTGMMLQQWCSGTEQSLDGMGCTYFLLGFLNGLSTTDGFADGASKVWCFPSGITAGQVELIVKKFMREHPEELHRSAAAIAGRALYIPYSCKKS